MEVSISRRKFGQLAIAGTATAAIGYFANKTWAQTPEITIFGVRAAARSPNPGGLAFQSLTLPSGQIQNIRVGSIQNGLQPGEKLTGFTILGDGTFALAISPLRVSKKEGTPSRIIYVKSSSGIISNLVNATVSEVKNLTVTLKKQERIESLLFTNDGLLYALAIKKNGRPPVDLVSVDPNSGAINSSQKVQLPQTERFIQLTQGSDGNLYAVAVNRLGETQLVQLEGKGKPSTVAQLKINRNNGQSKPLDNGLQDLIASPGSSNQFFALASLREDLVPHKLYTVNRDTGAMDLLREWDMTKIALPPAKLT